VRLRMSSSLIHNIILVLIVLDIVLCLSQLQGLANAASAGMLLYISQQLVAEHNKYVAKQYAAYGAGAAAAAAPGLPSVLPFGASSSLEAPPLRHQRICFVPGTILLSHVALVAGALSMLMIGFWA